MAGSLLQEFLAVQEVEPEKPRRVLLHQWRPPELDVHRVNFDAAVFKASNSAGIGVVVRDWCGMVVGALSMPIPLSNLVADLEALACHHAVQFAGDLGLHRVFFRRGFDNSY